MYVVTRTFRDKNGVFPVGSIVEPTGVRTFKSRLQQKHIVKVDEHNITRWANFFKNRYGIELTDKLSEVVAAEAAYVAKNGPVENESLIPESEPEASVDAEDGW